MSEPLGIELPPTHPATGMVPNNGAYQCPVCHGIAFNPVCPYCADDEDDE